MRNSHACFIMLTRLSHRRQAWRPVPPKKCSLPDYKPVSVPLRAAAIHLGRTLLPGSSDLPESSSERAAPPLLFGLAPRGVCHAGRITPSAVRSYRTISPLPEDRALAHPDRAVYFLLHFP